MGSVQLGWLFGCKQPLEFLILYVNTVAVATLLQFVIKFTRWSQILLVRFHCRRFISSSAHLPYLAQSSYQCLTSTHPCPLCVFWVPVNVVACPLRPSTSKDAHWSFIASFPPKKSLFFHLKTNVLYIQLVLSEFLEARTCERGTI